MSLDEKIDKAEEEHGIQIIDRKGLIDGLTTSNISFEDWLAMRLLPGAEGKIDL